MWLPSSRSSPSPVWSSPSPPRCSTGTSKRSPRHCDVDAVLLEGVSKSFEKIVLRSGYTTLKTALTQVWSRNSPPRERVQALDGIALAVPSGATVGLLRSEEHT